MTDVSLLAVAVTVSVLAGCASVNASPSTQTPSAASATPSASPEPTASPASRTPLDQLVLTTTGFAELPLGSSPASFDPATSVVEIETVDCGEDRVESGWEAVEFDPNTRFSAFGVETTEDGVVTAVEVYSNLIATAHGISIGSTRAEVLEAYPGIDVVASDYRFDTYVIQDQGSWLRMAIVNSAAGSGLPETAHDTVQEMMASVDGIRDFAPDFHPLGVSCV